MQKNIYVILIFCSLYSCERNFNPVLPNVNDEEIAIIFTRQIDRQFYEFQVINNLKEPVWYLGYQKGSPIYSTQIFSENEWKHSGPGWCGTGLERIEFSPRESFLINIIKPDTDSHWRVGIHIYLNFEENSQLYWSIGRK